MKGFGNRSQVIANRRAQVMKSENEALQLKKKQNDKKAEGETSAKGEEFDMPENRTSGEDGTAENTSHTIIPGDNETKKNENDEDHEHGKRYNRKAREALLDSFEEFGKDYYKKEGPLALKIKLSTAKRYWDYFSKHLAEQGVGNYIGDEIQAYTFEEFLVHAYVKEGVVSIAAIGLDERKKKEAERKAGPVITTNADQNKEQKQVPAPENVPSQTSPVQNNSTPIPPAHTTPTQAIPVQKPSVQDVTTSVDKAPLTPVPAKPETKIPDLEQGNIVYEKVAPGKFNNSGYQFSSKNGKVLNPGEVYKFIQEEKKKGNEEFITAFKAHVKGKDAEGTYPTFEIAGSKIKYFGYSFDPEFGKKKEKEKEVEKEAKPEMDTGAAKKLLQNRQELLKHYQDYKKIEGAWKNIPGKDEFGVRDKERERMHKQEDAARTKLLSLLKENGFSSLGELDVYISNYEKNFEKKTLALAEQSLQQYEKQLKEEENKLNNDAYLTQLFRQLSSSGAGQHFREASSNSDAANSITRDLGGYAYGDVTLKASLRAKASSEQAKGVAAVKQLNTPLVKESQFDHKKLASAKSKEEVRELLKKYIREKQESIGETREDLRKHPDHIYELDVLLKLSYEGQHVEPGSILDIIVQDKRERINGEKILSAVCFVVIAAAVTALTFGGGSLLLVGSIASVGVSAYGVYEATEQYKRQNAANDVSFLSNDPSLAWVIIAIAGAAVDITALGLLAKAGKTFNEGKNILLLEKQLKEIKGLESTLQQNVLKQARIQAQREKLLQGLAASRKLTYATLPYLHQTGELIARAIFAIRKGIVSFDSFIAELRTAKIIKETGLTIEEIKLCKQTFEKAKVLAKDDKLVAEMEKALSDKDFGKLENLMKDAGKSNKYNEGFYNGPKPKYDNPGHHDPKSSNFRGGGSKTEVIPENHEELWKRAIPGSSNIKTKQEIPSVWYSIDGNGKIHQFQVDHNGIAHWAGSENGARGIVVDNQTRKRLLQYYNEFLK